MAERFNRTLTDMLTKRAKQSGKDWDAHLPFVLFQLTKLVYKSQQRNHLFINCMDVIPSCQLPLDWTVGSSSISLIWILIRQKWLLNFLKPGSWQGTILRKHNSARRSTMTAGQDYQGLRWVIEVLFICLLPRHQRRRERGFEGFGRTLPSTQDLLLTI